MLGKASRQIFLFMISYTLHVMTTIGLSCRSINQVYGLATYTSPIDQVHFKDSQSGLGWRNCQGVSPDRFAEASVASATPDTSEVHLVILKLYSIYFHIYLSHFLLLTSPFSIFDPDIFAIILTCL